MLSIRKLLPLFLIPLLLVVFISPAEAQRRGGQRRATTRIQRKAPPMRQVQRSAPRQVRRNAPRQIRRSAPRQVRRNAPRQVRRSAPRQVRRSAPRQVRRNAPRQVRSSAPRQVRRNAPRQVQRSAPRQVRRNAPRQVQRSAPRQVQRSSPNRQFNRSRSSASQPRFNRQPQQREQRQTNSLPNYNRRPDRQVSRGPQRQYNPSPGRRGDQSSPRRQERRFDNNQRRPGRQLQDFNQRPDRQMTRGQRQNRPRFTQQQPTTGPTNNGNRNTGVDAIRPGRRNPASVQGLAVRRPVQNINTNTNVNVNNTYSQPVYTQPVYANSRPVVYNNYCPPNYYNDFYSPVIYNDYWVRRRYRRYNNCGNLFFSLGFFLSRPYSYYDYARVGYTNPIIYGDDNYYRPPVVEEGGPAEPDAVTAEGEVAVAPTQPALNTPEERMLSEVGNFVEKNSVEGRYRINDTAFSNQVWLLELAQAPAVFEIKDGLYSVVAGFEGTLGTSNVPSNVNVEFFVAKTANGFEVRDAWITSANGIARNKLYQSPVFPDVKTWESGKKCPFTGQPMIPIPPAASSEHG